MIKSVTKGYPVELVTGIPVAIKQLDSNDITYDPGTGKFSLTGIGVTPATCYIQYDEDVGGVDETTGMVFTGC